jgi:hypothetical protein
MSAGPRYYLDRLGDARLKPGCRLIESEVEFLRHIRTSAPCHLRGKILCEWAAQLAQARGWEVVFLSSPTKTLLDSIPGLTEAQAQELLVLLGSRFDILPTPITASVLLQTFVAADFWCDEPSTKHAAQWLLWLDANDVPNCYTPLLAVQSEKWMRDCNNVLQPAYAALNREAARDVLRGWFRIEISASFLPEVFPLKVPPHWVQEAQATWQQAAVQTAGLFYAEIARIELPQELQKAAAKAAHTYFCANIAHLGNLDPTSRAYLRRHLTIEENAELVRLRPPATPSPLPLGLPNVLRWFQREYLPYRLWQSQYGDEATAAIITQIAMEYACWLLQAYPTAMHSTNSEEYECLSIACARHLRESRENHVTFWIILDGMLYSDAEALLDMIETEPRLTRETLRPVLSPLPTITRFCKPALMNGTAHATLAEEPDPIPTFEGAELLRRNIDPAVILRDAEAGKIYVWSLVEPDASYHQRGADRATILRNVQSELEKTANAIKTAARAVPNALRLRIVIATDHGRLLSPARRTHSVPAGMETHGRAAFGASAKLPTREGFLIEAGIATLFGSRFDLHCDVMVPLDGDAFRMNNDATGFEHFSHGGMYPEETIVPWVEIVRDRTTPKIRVIVRGKARAGAYGTLEIVLENASTVPVVLRLLTVRPAGQIPIKLPYDLELRGQTRFEGEAEIQRWFRAAEARLATATACFEQTNGTTFEVEAEIDVQSVEMYQRENLLEDL